MTINIVRAAGIPVLACTKSDPSLHLPCSLVVRCSKSDKQATISLRFSFPLHRSDGQATFTLLYDADNLVPGINSLVPTNIPIPESLLDPIAQGGNPDYRILSLTTVKTCPIWCSGSSKSIAHVQNNDAHFRQFSKLARLLEIQVLFDHKWIPTQNHALLQDIIHHPERLTGLPVDERRKDRHRYILQECPAASPVGDVVSELPPPYSAESSTKRSRQTGSTTESPSPKRVLRSPIPAGSPTEKATSVPASSPKAPFVPITCASDFQDAVTNALITVLPQVLTSLLALPSSPSSSFASSPSPTQTPTRKITPDPPPHPLSRAHSALRALLTARGASHAEARLEHILDSAVLHAAGVRSAADSDFAEYLQELKCEVAMEKDDAIVEVNNVVDASLARLKEEIEGFEEEVWERLEGRCDDVVRGREERGKGMAREEVCEGEGEGCGKREVRKRELQVREREMEMCEREREVCQRERDVARREKDVGKREKEIGRRRRLD